MVIDEEILLRDLSLLASKFYKVIEVNLNEDTYFEVKVSDGEETTKRKGLMKWVEAFAAGGGVHGDDLEAFRKFFDQPMLLRDKVGESWQRVFYRRKIGNEWRMVCMEVLPMENFCEEEAIVLLVVRDVEDYVKDWRAQYNDGGDYWKSE